MIGWQTMISCSRRIRTTRQNMVLKQHSRRHALWFKTRSTWTRDQAFGTRATTVLEALWQTGRSTRSTGADAALRTWVRATITLVELTELLRHRDPGELANWPMHEHVERSMADRLIFLSSFLPVLVA